MRHESSVSSRGSMILIEWFVGWSGISYFMHNCYGLGVLKLVLSLFVTPAGIVWWWVDWMRTMIAHDPLCAKIDAYKAWNSYATFAAVFTSAVTVALNAIVIYVLVMLFMGKTPFAETFEEQYQRTHKMHRKMHRQM